MLIILLICEILTLMLMVVTIALGQHLNIVFLLLLLFTTAVAINTAIDPDIKKTNDFWYGIISIIIILYIGDYIGNYLIKSNEHPVKQYSCLT